MKASLALSLFFHQTIEFCFFCGSATLLERNKVSTNE